MGNVIYTPVIDDMVWSYSRAKAFEDCPYRWYLKYIRYPEDHGKSMFFSDYGLFMHKLLEQYYSGKLTKPQMKAQYLKDFKRQVRARAPNPKVFSGYFKSGLNYISGFRPFPYKMVAVEKEVYFEIDGIPLKGYIDYLGENDGSLYLIDHKSRTLKPRSGRKKPTKADRELDSYLRQLYLYSAAVEQEFGVLPKALCFNCFREPVFIEEQFDMAAYEESKRWFIEKRDKIRIETDFKPCPEYWKCNHLCEMQDFCEYFKML